MKKLEAIKIVCDEAVEEYRALLRDNPKADTTVEYARAEMADEILEILNGELK